MKRFMTLTIALIIVLQWGPVCFAEMGKEMKHRIPASEKPMMQGMPMGKMMGKKMVATPDGGVVVMMCHKLYKFDKDLTLVKEAEVPFDTAHMEKMMKNMNEMRDRMCPRNMMPVKGETPSQPK